MRKNMDIGSQSDQVKDAAEQAVENLEQTTEDLQNRIGELWENGRERVAACMKATDRTIRNNPYPTIGVALGVGIVIGLLINRARD